MKKSNTQSLSDVLKEVFQDQHLQDKFNEQRIIDSWEPLLGQGVAQYTSKLYIRNKVLNVHITSAVLKAELMMSRDKLIKTLNEKVGEWVINDIMFR